MLLAASGASPPPQIQMFSGDQRAELFNWVTFAQSRWGFLLGGWLFSFLLCALLPFEAGCFSALFCAPTLSSAELCIVHCHAWDRVTVFLCRTRPGCPRKSLAEEVQTRLGRAGSAGMMARLFLSILGLCLFKSELQKTKTVCGCSVQHTCCCQGSPDTLWFSCFFSMWDFCFVQQHSGCSGFLLSLLDTWMWTPSHHHLLSPPWCDSEIRLNLLSSGFAGGGDRPSSSQSVEG